MQWIKKWKKKVMAWFSRFRKTSPAETPAPVEGDVESLPDYLSGSWKLSRLLEQLPQYHDLLDKLYKHRNTNLGTLIRMGPTIIADGEAWLSTTDEHLDLERLPSQFFCSWGSPKQGEETLQPTLLAGMKVERPWNVQPLPGDCYEFLFYYADFWEDGRDEWFSSHLYVHNNKVVLANTVRTVINRIQRNGKKPIEIPAIKWDNDLRYMFESKNTGKWSIDDLLLMLFRSMLLWWEERKKRWLVITKQSGHRVSFAVEEGRHKYFFRDRDKTVTTPTGKRKTIFHVCSEHYRTLKSGKAVLVKEHTRGIRHFFWKDCETHIFAPGWHGKDVFTLMDATMHFFDDDENPGEMVDGPGFTEKVARIMEGTSVRH